MKVCHEFKINRSRLFLEMSSDDLIDCIAFLYLQDEKYYNKLKEESEQDKLDSMSDLERFKLIERAIMRGAKK